MKNKIEIGKIYYFGYRRTKNVVTSVTTLENNSKYQARVSLKGPRGGEFIAFVRHDGSCVKI